MNTYAVAYACNFTGDVKVEVGRGNTWKDVYKTLRLNFNPMNNFELEWLEQTVPLDLHGAKLAFLEVDAYIDFKECWD